MRLKLIFSADVKDSEDMRGLCEQIGLCFEGLGDVRLISVSQVSGSEAVKMGRGPYKNVMLSDEAMRELENRLGSVKAAVLIDEFSYKLYQKGYRFKDHFAAILEWAEGGTPSSDGCASSPALGKKVIDAKAQSFDVDDFFNAAVKRTAGD